MIPLTLSRVRLRARRGEVLSAIAPLLIPDNPERRAGHAHRVLWLLFQDNPDAKRDFLWRDEGNGRYLVLPTRPPTDPSGLFEIGSKEFAPDLRRGDRLLMQLRANPTRASKAALNPEDRARRAASGLMW
jgi:CRISPR system Cascade subunit CasE